MTVDEGGNGGGAGGAAGDGDTSAAAAVRALAGIGGGDPSLTVAPAIMLKKLATLEGAATEEGSDGGASVAAGDSVGSAGGAPPACRVSRSSEIAARSGAE